MVFVRRWVSGGQINAKKREVIGEETAKHLFIAFLLAESHFLPKGFYECCR